MAILKYNVLAILAMLCASSEAFIAPNSKRAVSTRLFENAKEPPFIPMPKYISYGEESRKYRRTVYTHDDWVKHRSPDRFVRNAVSTITSGIYKNIANEVYFVTGIATVLCLGNAMTGTYQDFSGVVHDGFLKDSIIPSLSLPMNPFTLSSGSLGLLLGKTALKFASYFHVKLLILGTNFLSFQDKQIISTMGRSS